MQLARSVAGLVNILCFTDYQKGPKLLGQIVRECKSQSVKIRLLKFQNQVKKKNPIKRRKAITKPG